MGTDCKSAAFQLRWFESTRAHQENACVEIHERFSFAQTANSRRRVDSNSIGRRYPSRRQKSPCGAFLDARLAQPTRTHQENACVEIHERFSFAQTANSRKRVDSNRAAVQSTVSNQPSATTTTTACGRNREELLGPRSDFSKPRQEAVEKSANATRCCCLARGSGV